MGQQSVSGPVDGVEPAVSFWHRSAGPAPVRPRLEQDIESDICIVGAGYTGLWTAWALAREAPHLAVTVLEARQAGWGSSGRNGGWLSGLMPGNREIMARHPSGRAGVAALQRALIDSVGSVEKICRDLGIDADILRGGNLTVATNPNQLDRIRRSLAEDREWGLDEEDLSELDAGELAGRIRLGGPPGGPAPLGALYTPHCARIHPAKLVHGLAQAVEGEGVRIYEHSPATGWFQGSPDSPGRWTVRTPAGSVKARWLVLATEAYTPDLPGRPKRLVPLNSSMIVTSRLPARFWEHVGWEAGETLIDASHVYTYLQRTADNRIAIGGRGIPYRFGSRTDGPEQPGGCPPSTVSGLEDALRRLFPTLPLGRLAEDAWSGVIGVARDWCPSVVSEPSGDGGIAWAGGYVGDGVTASHLAGLTLADLVLGRDTDLTALPWVGHRGRDWEPEPLRFLGIRTVYRLYRWADRLESTAWAGDAATRGHPARAPMWASGLLAGTASRLAGRH
jgi:glycine/D-amino acid oxidase-like deaminating enzyme